MLEVKWQNVALISDGNFVCKAKTILFNIANNHRTLDIFA